MENKKGILQKFCCNERSILGRMQVAKLLQFSVNILWVGIAIISLYIAIKEIFHLIELIISNDYEINKILHEIVTIFIYIEIVAMVIKYFEENYHFPLRYIIYIAITALARHIIGDFEHAYDYSIAILLLAIAYFVLRLISHITKNKEQIPPYER